MVRKRRKSDREPLWRRRDRDASGGDGGGNMVGSVVVGGRGTGDDERVRDELLRQGEERLRDERVMAVYEDGSTVLDGRTGGGGTAKTLNRVTAYLDDIENAWLGELAAGERMSRSAFLRRLVVEEWKRRRNEK